jgi:hypothetical protein
LDDPGKNPYAPTADECRAAMSVQESDDTMAVLRLIVSSYARLSSLRHEDGLRATNSDVVLKLLAYKLHELVYPGSECDKAILESYLNALKQAGSMQGVKHES